MEVAARPAAKEMHTTRKRRKITRVVAIAVVSTSENKYQGYTASSLLLLPPLRATKWTTLAIASSHTSSKSSFSTAKPNLFVHRRAARP